jgi:hypothetical protein
MKSEHLDSVRREIALLEAEVHEMRELEIKEKEFIKSYLYEKMRNELDQEALRARTTLQEEKYEIYRMRESVKEVINLGENLDIYSESVALLLQKLGA